MEDGPPFNPELLAQWETLEGPELEKFTRGLGEYIDGLAAALEDPDMVAEDRAELEEQLKELRDSHEAISAKLGPVRVKKE